MSNAIKLVSGFILFVIGVLIAYETITYNLLGILIIVGLFIAIVGILVIISYFIDTNADRTLTIIKDFLDSKEVGSSAFGKSGKNSNSNGPLRVRSEFNNSDLDDGYTDIYEENFYDDSNAVLNIPDEEDDVNFDNPLKFTPYYGRPLKVTRSPKRRKGGYYVEEVPEIVVEPNNNSEEIQTALAQEEPVNEVLTEPKRINNSQPSEEIKIDVNNPESLPVPKSLRSYILSGEGFMTSQEAFDNLAINVNKEIMLEIPSLNDLSDRVLSHVPTIYSRVIINEFDVSDMSYMFLISSLLKQGVHIKTVPKVHSVNLITDDSYAMIISEGKDIEYGAIYDDRNSISSIRADFEKVWNIASSLDESYIINSVGVANGD
ncbi:hypothetical protein [uncultured Methanobrevibacter sp.]|uniref:hypothetical protein n=1 Tax=uncultured Methanobrevibacter sp. TaxID=253161 RepID=UPI0025ECF835|nr:hypothetical protein [uncultured Methanobrevibacter sp.]